MSKALEKDGHHHPEEVALFLMRCIFTMFAEDVELLPKDSFKHLLERCAADPSKFVPMVEQLWKAMDTGDFAYAIERKVMRFNGKLFKGAQAIPLAKEEIGELLAAASADWREVEPAIFGTLLEQALDEKERARLGAHYTPRAYVETLVVATVIEPLRQEWAQVQATAERVHNEAATLAKPATESRSKRNADAVAIVRAFHTKLCGTRVLDPACGTGNFLHVSLEHLKKLEGEVLEALLDLGGQESLAGSTSKRVDPHQFLGLELNPRAAAIAELVIWLGYLQWHFRTKGKAPSEPILRRLPHYKAMNAVLTWDGYPDSQVEVQRRRARFWLFPMPGVRNGPKPITSSAIRPLLAARTFAPHWAMSRRRRCGACILHINDSADFVMYWWDRAADIVARWRGPSASGLLPRTPLRRCSAAAWSRDIWRRKSRFRF